MVASADMSHLGKLLEHELNNDPFFKDVRITFEDFKNFAELRKKLLPINGGVKRNPLIFGTFIQSIFLIKSFSAHSIGSKFRVVYICTVY
jgi:hypothetical protein